MTHRNLLLCLLFFIPHLVFSQTLWQGEKMTFSKAAYADWTLAENQDRITDEIWLTRANVASLFNINQEAEYEIYVSPIATEWALGTTEEIASLQFDSFQALVDSSGNGPQSLIGKELVLHIPNDDIYIDITFLSWGGGNSGAPFSYERSTPGTVSTNEGQYDPQLIHAYPNPVTDWLYFDKPVYGDIIISDQTGKVISLETWEGKSSMYLNHIAPGFYTLQITELSNKIQTIKIIKL